MEFIQKLPFVLSVFMAIIIGMFSLKFSISRQQIYTNMIIGMLVFFALGTYIRYSIVKIKDEIEDKKKEEERKQSELVNNSMKESNTDKSFLDLKVDDDITKYVYDDDFLPMKISEIMNTENKAK